MYSGVSGWDLVLSSISCQAEGFLLKKNKTLWTALAEE